MGLDAIECDSRIERVEVYARGALVTRRVALPGELPRGPVDLVVGAVTPLAEPGSARALLEGARAVTALRARLVLPAAPAAPGALVERVRALELVRMRLGREHAHAKARQELFSSVALDAGLRGRARPADVLARVRDGLAVDALVTARVAALDARLRELAQALGRNERDLEAARLEAAQGGASAALGEAPPTYQFVVRLAAQDDAGGAVKGLALVYAVPAARWWPAYTARFTEGGARARWSLEAFVAQCTGEDWSGVALALSTADLVHDARLPELPSLRLSRAQPPARRGYRPPPAGLDALFEGYDRAVAGARGHGAADARTRGETAADVLVPAERAEPLGGVVAVEEQYEEEAEAELATLDEVTATGSTMSVERKKAEGGLAGKQRRPEPQAQAAPLVMGAAEVSPPKSAGLFRGFGGAPPAPPGAPMSASMPARSRASFSRAAPPMEVPAAPPSAIEPADDWLDFDALALAPAEDRARRGRLSHQARPDAARRAHEATRAIEAVAPPLLARDPRETRGRFDHRYEGEARVDLPATGAPHRVLLASADAAPRVGFRAVPRESPEVYREAEQQNPFDAPLLAGPVEVFIDGALTATSSIAAVDRGGTVWLGLGVEDRLRVARNARVEEASAGLLGGSTAVEHAVTIDLSSSLGHAVRVDVVDRVPVTNDKDVEISRSFARPPWEPYDQAERGEPVKGGLRWRVEVPAGGKARVEFGYRVTLPAKSEIEGGNRRE